MGTRHAIVIKSDDKIALSQYGQWDGDYSWTGNNITTFIKDHFTNDDKVYSHGVQNFKENLQDLQILDDETCNSLIESAESVYNTYGLSVPLSLKLPTLSGDTGADILKIIRRNFNSKLPTTLYYDYNWVEFVYLIDMDAQTLCCTTCHDVNKRRKVEVKNKWVSTLQKTSLKHFTCFMEMSFEEIATADLKKLFNKFKKI